MILREARARLEAAGCAQAALDARLLLQAAAGLSHTDIAADPERTISPPDLKTFDTFVTRRAAREPVSRILGSREFYGRPFRVTPAVLDPRPDTETLIEAALPHLKPGARILDLGTGSGAILLTLLAERPDATGVATDNSPEALDVARGNALALGVGTRVTFVCGSWFEPVSRRFDLIASNPPYIPAGEIAGLAPDVTDFDPRGALDGGPDGLGPYREIASGAPAHLKPGGLVLVEFGAGQAEAVELVFNRAGFSAAGTYRDLGGHVRCAAFRLT